jgi:acylphosphatase
MTPPDTSSREAEIYVEGKRKMVDGFVRWCKKSDVGLSQVISVTQVIEEEPTGLYNEFYCKIREGLQNQGG